MSAASLTDLPARLLRRAARNEQPLTAHLELTYCCNWACDICYNPRSRPVELTTEDWRTILRQLHALGTLIVTFTGGEPLTRPDFVEIAHTARRLGLAVRVMTNGSLVTSAVAGELAALFPLGVELSLHGARPETHDAATGRPGSFDAALEGARNLRACGVRVLLKSVVRRRNQDEIESMVALAEGLGASALLDTEVLPRDDGDQSALAERPTPDAVERAFRVARSAGGLPTASREPGGYVCALGRTTLGIDPAGNVFPCSRWRTSALGNIRSSSLETLWRHPARRRYADVASQANRRLLEIGGAVARFPFCPAQAAQQAGDPCHVDDFLVARAAIAERVRSE
jgi:MoaA/NifB/PqqE/SkfB family radical SAM enzyme